MITAAVLAFVLTGGMAAAGGETCATEAAEVEAAMLAEEAMLAAEAEAEADELFEEAEADFAARQDEIGLIGSTLARDAASASALVTADTAAETPHGEGPAATDQK